MLFRELDAWYLAQSEPFNGRVVQPEEVLGEPQRGAKLFFAGDVSHTGPLHKIAEGADLLAVEATYLEADKQLARQHGHITASAAAGRRRTPCT